MYRPRHHNVDPTLAALAIACAVSLAVLLARDQSLLLGLELTAFDYQVRWMPERQDWTARSAVVEVTEQDIQNLGNYPISDAQLAQAIETLIDAGARAIGIDIYRDIPVPPGTGELDAVFRRAPQVVVPSKFADEGAHGVAPPKALAGTQQVAFTNMVLDPDGTARRGLLYMEDEHGNIGVAMALSLALLYLAHEEIYPSADPEDPDVMALGTSRIRPLASSFGGYVDLDTGGYQYMLDFRGARELLPGTDLTTLLSGDADPEIFRDRMVMIGVTAVSLGDNFRTPLRRGTLAGEVIPGVEIHGRMADQLVAEALGELEPLKDLAGWQETVLVVFASLLAAGMTLRLRSGWGLGLATFGGLATLFALGLASMRTGYWMPLVPPGVAWAVSLFAVAAYTRGRERAERVELMHLFSRHVTKQVAEDVWNHRVEFLEDGRPKPVRLTATVLFIDIRSYSEKVEKMDPADVMEWMDGFLGAMAQQVLDRGGMVEDYFGDGMMACYGIPIPSRTPEEIRRDADNAVKSALAMRRSLSERNADRDAEGLPPVSIRVGISTGVVVAGSMGSSNRLKYAVVGDSVVTAQRLESIGLDRVQHDFDESPARILISESTFTLIDPAFQIEPVGSFLVKGKTQPVEVHRVIGRSEPRRAEAEEDLA